MEKIWDVTIMKIGSIQIEAETEDEAIKKSRASCFTTRKRKLGG